MQPMVLVYLPASLGDFVANVGIHLPAPWFAHGFYLLRLFELKTELTIFGHYHVRFMVVVDNAIVEGRYKQYYKYIYIYYESQPGSWLVIVCERSENRGLGGGVAVKTGRKRRK